MYKLSVREDQDKGGYIPMASKEYLEERVAKAKEFIEKKTNTITKKESLIVKKTKALEEQYHIKVEGYDKHDRTGRTKEEYSAIYWGICDIEGLERDVKSLKKSIEEKTASLNKYNEELFVLEEKARSRNVEIILNFLEEWKDRVYSFYNATFEEYFKEKEALQNLGKALDELPYGSEEYEACSEEYKRSAKAFLEHCEGEYKEDETRPRWDKKVKVKEGKYEFCKPYIHSSSLEEAQGKLKKALTREAELKYDDIIERTNKIVGEITDASFLRCNEKGNLDGIIYGTRGAANVETIGAGGYNIQCYHFRTLIHEIRPQSLKRGKSR